MHKYIHILSHIECILWVHREYILLPKQNVIKNNWSWKIFSIWKLDNLFKNQLFYCLFHPKWPLGSKKKKCETKSGCNFEFKLECWRFFLYLLKAHVNSISLDFCIETKWAILITIDDQSHCTWSPLLTISNSRNNYPPQEGSEESASTFPLAPQSLSISIP